MMRSQKKEPWRIILGIISVAAIVIMWIKKDIAGIYSTMPSEAILPMIITTIGVSAVKVVAIAAVIFLIKTMLKKLRKDK